mmetsp:Transcript_19261/g.54398  ORF Transcript_19261/g.54398 Transcript_19261/m.54398 type:complete len:255 (+) Transcript_19261:71-835(+)
MRASAVLMGARRIQKRSQLMPPCPREQPAAPRSAHRAHFHAPRERSVLLRDHGPHPTAAATATTTATTARSAAGATAIDAVTSARGSHVVRGPLGLTAGATTGSTTCWPPLREKEDGYAKPPNRALTPMDTLTAVPRHASPAARRRRAGLVTLTVARANVPLAYSGRSRSARVQPSGESSPGHDEPVSESACGSVYWSSHARSSSRKCTWATTPSWSAAAGTCRQSGPSGHRTVLPLKRAWSVRRQVPNTHTFA